jgi:16S rRNA (cytidine1402-2'-O)-methyltransferase
LYVVATPIGNLGDLSPRAVLTLRSVSAVVCEDTRRTRVLLDHAGVATPLVALPPPREAERAPGLVARLVSGESLALVSDAGTPLVSDPGNRLVSAAHEAGVRVVPIPGPSALTTLLAACPLPVDRFQFVGFAPKKGKGRTDWLAGVRGYPGTSVFFANGHELDELLAELAPEAGVATVSIGRELTKLHEEVVTGDAATTRPSDRRGELAVAIRFAPRDEQGPGDEGLRASLTAMLRHGMPPSEAARVVAELSGRPRKEIYRMAMDLTPPSPLSIDGEGGSDPEALSKKGPSPSMERGSRGEVSVSRGGRS